jgi:hypothetical protein
MRYPLGEHGGSTNGTDTKGRSEKDTSTDQKPNAVEKR